MPSRYCLSPRYVVDRVLESAYRWRHPGLPWLTPAANRFLEEYLRPTDVGLEFGSGRSTLWFARHLGQFTSVEHDEGWYRRVRASLDQAGVANTCYHHVPQDVPHEDGANSAYARILERFGDDTLDIVLVDGVYRDACALRALAKLRAGGLLVIDNVNWYLPCRSRAPASRRPSDGPATGVWRQVWESVAPWRRYWTSNGVTDTALFFKPAPARALDPGTTVASRT